MAYLITGVPGFLASRLARALAPEGKPLYLLCEKRFEDKARALAESLASGAGGGRGAPAAATLAAPGAPAAPSAPAPRCRVVPGDITKPDLGLAPADLAAIREEVREVYHLAAIYDLAVPYGLARRVNVEGTRNVVELCGAIPSCRHSYVSTCYVAGDRRGLVREEDLEKGQGFKNHYESTKYEAERVVRASQGRIETRIFRPSVVIGDSRTGETEKFDGPYFAFRAVRMGLLAVLPGPSLAAVNLVPVDFVIQALAAIPKRPDTAGKTFALADSAPMAARDIIALAAERLGAPRPRGSIPAWLFKLPLRAGCIARGVGIPLESVDYFNTDVRFDTANTQAALAGTGVACPALPSYLDAILGYYKARAKLPWAFG